jgi:hypothetical protein
MQASIWRFNKNNSLGKSLFVAFKPFAAPKGVAQGLSFSY